MAKYLFLLGFFLFSISFLAGCKTSSFYSALVADADSDPVAKTDSAPVADTDSAPVTNTDSDPVADADSAPVTDTDSARVLYSGIVYRNEDVYAVSCGFVGVAEIIQKKTEKKLPDDCEEGAFSIFILLETRGRGLRGSTFTYVRSFISANDGRTWKEAYLKVSKSLTITSCDQSEEYKTTRDQAWVDNCNLNLASYKDYKEKNPTVYIREEAKRSPDSIEE